MSRLFFLCVVTAFLLILWIPPSFENRSKKVCANRYDDWQCRRRKQICCNGACNSTCVGKRCDWDFQCSSRDQGHKCCAGYCRASCEGQSCQAKWHCKDRSIKCCDQVCRKDSCLGATCSSAHPSSRTCGWHLGKRLECCSGRCELSCKDRPCVENRDCGGRSRRMRMKCCNGMCKKSCLGSSCYEHRDCQSRELDCCGFFENKTCARSCLNHECSLAETQECGRKQSPKLFCCGDGTCRATCLGSICYTETFRYDCQAPGRLLFCCGMGEKKCRLGCDQVVCEKNEDCGTSKYYCGRPDRHNVTTCTSTRPSDLIYRHDVRLDDLDFE